MDKFSKLWPLISKLNDRCMEYFPNETYFCSDESMVSYFGHHGCILLGESPFLLAIPFGVLPQIWVTFAGFSHTRVKRQILNMRNIASLAFKFWRQFQKHTNQDDTIFALDNFFTSIELVDKLSLVSYQTTDTVRKDHINKAFLEPRVAPQKKRGDTFNNQTDGTGNIFCI